MKNTVTFEIKKAYPKKPGCKLETLIKRKSNGIHTEPWCYNLKFPCFTCIQNDKLEAFTADFMTATRTQEKAQLYFNFKPTTAQFPIFLICWACLKLTLTKEYNHSLCNWPSYTTQTESAKVEVIYVNRHISNVIVSTPQSYKNTSTWNRSVWAVNTNLSGNTTAFSTTLKSKNLDEEEQFVSPWKQQ